MELTWRSVAEMVTGPDPVLLPPVALGSRSNGRPIKSVIGETDVSFLQLRQLSTCAGLKYSMAGLPPLWRWTPPQSLGPVRE